MEVFKRAILQPGPPENFALKTVQEVIKPQKQTKLAQDENQFLENILRMLLQEFVSAAASSEKIMQFGQSMDSSGTTQGYIPRLLDIVLYLCEKEHIEGGMIFQLLEDLTEMSTMKNCKDIFGYIESKQDILGKHELFARGKLVMLRTCNQLLRRLSKANDVVFCGRILMFLAHFFPLSERSALNIKGVFNTSNETKFEKEPLEGICIDFNFYQTFWGLQEFFSNPASVSHAPIKWQKFTSSLSVVLNTFEAQPLTDEEGDANNLEEEAVNFSIKYLTSSKLMGLELKDPSFRRHVLVQCLILFDYLKAPGKGDKDLPSESMKEEITSCEERVKKLLELTPPKGSEFLHKIEHILEREKNWVWWKRDGCLPYEKQPIEKKEVPEGSKKRRPRWRLGNKELSQLWKWADQNPERGSGRQIGEGYEAGGLYHFGFRPRVSCVAALPPKVLHDRFGHPNLSKLKKMCPELSGLQTLECESCQLGKHVRSVFPKRSQSMCTSSFSIIHSDVWGPSRVSSFGFRYFVTFIDEYSRCTWVYLMKDRSELLPIFTSFLNEIKNQFGQVIKVLRSDNAKEYFSSTFSSLLSSHGILHQSTCPHTPQQNGIAERKNRHLVETARTLLLGAHIPVHHWGDAILTACFLINRMPSSSLNNKVPFSILFPNNPLFHTSPRVFGCVCFVHDMSPGLDKLSARAIKCVFLGYSRLQKGYRCYSPETKKYYMSANVTFFEQTPFFSPSVQDVHILHQVLPLPVVESNISNTSVNPSHTQGPPEPSSPHTDILGHSTPMDNPLPENGGSPSSDSSPSPSLVTPPGEDDSGWPIALRKGTRSTRNPHPIYNFLSYHRVSPSFYSLLSSVSSVVIPKSVKEALDHPGWRQAMIEEMQALDHSHTWELVPLPPGKKAVGCRWVYAIKVGPNGDIDRLKARLVAKGYTQVYGLDYCDTFSPVAKMTTIRLFFAMAAIRHWPLHQLDIKNAFLHGDLEEEVYMEQPPGFVAQGESGMVCKLNRSLYGLKQSPRAWFGKFSSIVQKFGLKRSEADHSVFYYHSSPGKCVYLIVYVDDIVITGNDTAGISQLKEYLCRHFQTKDLGSLKYFLGIEVAQSKDGVVISQRKYALDILQETGMIDCRPVDSPMDPNQKLTTEEGELFSDPERYRRLVGKLIYLTITRPDLSFAVGVVSQFMQAPCVGHWNAIIRILRYLKKAPGQGLLYEEKGSLQVSGYCDADWAGSPIDRRSTTGYCVFLGGNIISWKSKKQNVVARSTAEAEYRAMASLTCELIWVKQFLQELNFCDIQSMKMYCDNQAALHIASNPVFHERTKHIEIDCHFVREKLLSKEICTEFVGSNDQLADMLTKSLRGPRIEFICSKLGTYNLYAPA